MIRSFLFVPADSDRKLGKAKDAGADALILDLEDAVAPAARTDARALACDYLKDMQNAWVRINPIDTDDSQADLEGVMSAAPAGIVLPKPRSAAAVQTLAERLEKLERTHGLEIGSTKIIALCTEHPEALLTLHSYIGASERLYGLSWGAEDLSAALGASANRDSEGAWLPTYEMARSMCLIAAAAAEVVAIDTVYTNFRDSAGLQHYAVKARRDGFTGMLAIHPQQIETINEAFVPSTAEVDAAQRIVDGFAANPGAGTIGIDGRMIDRPHLVQAQRTLDLARQAKN